MKRGMDRPARSGTAHARDFEQKKAYGHGHGVCDCVVSNAMCRVIDHSVSCVQFLASRRQHTMSHVTEDTDVLITQLRKSKSSESGESETAKDNQSDCKVRSRDERGDESTPPRTHVSP